MTARNILIRGLIAGFIAGIITFAVAHQVGEPHVDAAIAVEEAGAAAEPAATDDHATDDHATDEHTHDESQAAGGHSHDESGTVVSRDNQSTWGLATGTIATGTALGGIVALVAAGLVGRIGRLRPAQSTALVALVGFVSVSFVPFLKYPATPPAVGNEDTIGARTGHFFLYMLISVVAAAAAVYLARFLMTKVSTYQAIVAATLAFIVVVAVFGQILPTVNEIGDFPADTLWYFRRASLITLATLWASIGIILTGLIGKLYEQDTLKAARKSLAASL
jgi:hypothetical protein